MLPGWPGRNLRFANAATDADRKFPTTTLEPGDRERWTELWRAYLHVSHKPNFPTTPTRRPGRAIIDPNGAIHALGVRDNDGRLVGITHS